MKAAKLILQITGLIILLFYQINGYTNAQDYQECQNDITKCYPKITPSLGDVLPNSSNINLDQETENQPGDPNKAPNILIKIATTVINILFYIAGSLGLIAAVSAGVMFVIGQGNEDMLGNGKKILTYGAIGFLIMAVAYALIIGISNLKLS